MNQAFEAMVVIEAVLRSVRGDMTDAELDTLYEKWVADARRNGWQGLPLHLRERRDELLRAERS